MDGLVRWNRFDELDHTIKSLSEFLDGSGGDWDWDDYTSLSLRDPKLNAIRKKAGIVDLPLDDDGRRTLEDLLAEARQEGSTASS